MSRPMRTSRKGLELIKSFEGFRTRSVQLTNGKWVIGYGHTKSARANLRITADDAELILRFRDLKPIEKLISERVLCPLSQNEFDALVSFVFNIGEDAFLASDVLGQLDRGDRLAAAESMSVWRKGEVEGALIVVDVFVRRRAAEKALFLEHPSGRVALPTALMRPKRDDDVKGYTLSASSMPPNREDDTDRSRPVSVQRETSPQAAARSVSMRLTRILGETEKDVVEAPLPSLPSVGAETVIEEPSIKEITDAIEALAGSGAQSDLPDPPGVSGPPEGIERRRPATQLPVDLPPLDLEPLSLTEPILPPIEGDFIDDTEIVEVSEDDIQRAIKENGSARVPTSELPGVLHWLPFALLSGLGLIGLIAGVLRFFEHANTAITHETAIYVGPLLALGGGFLLLISAYYLFRALTRAD